MSLLVKGNKIYINQIPAVFHSLKAKEKVIETIPIQAK
jgi:hypothetical protein